MFTADYWINAMTKKPGMEKAGDGAVKAPVPAKSPKESVRVERGTRIREVPAVKRAGQILRQLAVSQTGLTVSKLAQKLDIIPSTCLHILRELMAAHLVSFEPNGKTYRLGLGLLNLTKGLHSQDGFILAAERHLWRFAQETNVSVSAQERDGNDAVIVAAVAAGEGLEAPLGKRVAILSAAGGRLFAGHLDWTKSEMRKQFARVPWQNPPDFDDWLEEVEIAKTKGYAIDHENFRLGVTSIATSVMDKGGGGGRWVISINVVTAQLDEKTIDIYLSELKKASSKISDVLP